MDRNDQWIRDRFEAIEARVGECQTTIDKHSAFLNWALGVGSVASFLIGLFAAKIKAFVGIA